VALAVATALVPDQRSAPAAVLLSLIVGLVAAMPYTQWRTKVHAQAALAKPPPIASR
jgi:hypothetical protein